MRKIICSIIVALGAIVGGYVGLIQLMILPILRACSKYDMGLLSATIIGWTVIKCVFAIPIGVAIFLLFSFVGGMIVAIDK